MLWLCQGHRSHCSGLGTNATVVGCNFRVYSLFPMNCQLKSTAWALDSTSVESLSAPFRSCGNVHDVRTQRRASASELSVRLLLASAYHWKVVESNVTHLARLGDVTYRVGKKRIMWWELHYSLRASVSYVHFADIPLVLPLLKMTRDSMSLHLLPRVYTTSLPWFDVTASATTCLCDVIVQRMRWR